MLRKTIAINTGSVHKRLTAFIGRSSTLFAITLQPIIRSKQKTRFHNDQRIFIAKPVTSGKVAGATALRRRSVKDMPDSCIAALDRRPGRPDGIQKSAETGQHLSKRAFFGVPANEMF
jgi:hypothetical protein